MAARPKRETYAGRSQYSSRRRQKGPTSEQLSLGPLQDNGGETETHLPAADSIAIDLIAVEECAIV